MARSHYRGTVYAKVDGVAKPLPGAAIRLYDIATGQPWAEAVYPDPVNGVPYVIPLITNAVGEIDIWADVSARVGLTVAHPKFHGTGGQVDIEPDPALEATDEDVAESVAEHEAKLNPHAQYLTEQEGGDLFLPLAHQPGTNPHPQYATDTDLSAHLASGDDHPLYFNQARGDLRYEQLTTKGMPLGYVPLGSDGKIPNTYLPDLAITETFVVVSEAEMLALDAQTGDVAVRLDTSENYILAAEPATVLANWTRLAASSAAGNVSVVSREEFAPAAAATSVVLAAVPTEILSVSRNGVEQSALAAHFTVAGVTVTFADAFVAGERVGVVYEVGSAGGGGGGGGGDLTQAQADLLYEPIDSAYTKSEADTKYSLTAHNHDGAYSLLAHTHAGVYSPVAHNHDASYATAAHNHSTLYEPLDSAYTKAEADGKYALTAHTHTGTYLPMAGGTLTGNLGVRTAPEAWQSIMHVIRLGQTGAVFSDSTTTDIEMISNSYADSGGTYRAIVTGAAVGVSCMNGTFSVFQAPSVAAGAAQTFAGRMDVNINGTLGLSPTAGAAPVTINGTPQPKITVNVTAPSSPNAGDLWVW